MLNTLVIEPFSTRILIHLYRELKFGLIRFGKYASGTGHLFLPVGQATFAKMPGWAGVLAPIF